MGAWRMLLAHADAHDPEMRASDEGIGRLEALGRDISGPAIAILGMTNELQGAHWTAIALL